MVDSMYLDNLEEFINDEGKIVTYKWLSLTLGVHTNTAKQMLYHFVEKQRKADKGDLNVTYFVSGVEKGEGECPDIHKMIVVPEENLAITKSKLKDVSSVHVYSVQKAKLTDLSLLYTANYDTVKEHILDFNKHSGIVCPDATFRSSADLEKLQKGSAYQPPPEPIRPESKYKKRETEDGDKKPIQKNNKTKGGQIANMFAQQAKKSETKDKTDVKKENTDNNKESKSSSKSTSKTKPGMSSFFNKGPVPKKEIKEEDEKQTPSSPTKLRSSPRKVKENTKEEKEEEKEEEEEIKMEVDSPVKKSPIKKNKKQTKSKTSKGSQQRGKNKRKVEEEEAPKTKRKRILLVSDSESSGDEDDDDAEAADRANRSPTPPPSSPNPALDTARIESDSDDEDMIPPTPQDSQAKGRARKKKLVTKTFTGDEGFIVTNKEYEFVEDSGDEENTAADTTTTTTTTTTGTSDNSPATSQSSSTTASKTSPKKEKSPKQKTTTKTTTKDSPKKKGSKASKKSQDTKKQASIKSFFTKK